MLRKAMQETSSTSESAASTPLSTEPAVRETAAEARARRAIHVIGAGIIALVVLILVAAIGGGARWAKARQMRAIQEVATADLQLIVESEKRFFEQNGFYTTDLAALKVLPKKVLYAFGFVSPAKFPEASSKPEWNPEMRTIVRLVDSMKDDPKWAEHIGLSPATRVRSIDFDRLISYCPDCTATKTSFKAVAAANLDDDPVLDVWIVNEKNEVQHVLDDLK
ncbi:MAG: hypothetical protein JNJ49_08725 [Bdellovibrionaceae bacterium]|nr:hypothetical protein [Pseudobdellovibrionaceae bacterium]